jgi:curved DNA-binding protein CbpA
MNSFTDYYALLGVAGDAPPASVKAAFKKQALKYHPDVYKGEDAHERMRQLLLAYQTLNDPAARRQYDVVRSEYIIHGKIPHQGVNTQTTVPQPNQGAPSSNTRSRSRSTVSPSARRDRQRYYDFPDFRADRPVYIDLIDIDYRLHTMDASTLKEQGLLRGVAPENDQHFYFCHRCHHRWKPDTTKDRATGKLPGSCPHCHAADWTEYLLLRCIHCCAVFESEQIRYEIGIYTYGAEKSRADGALCPPYELFPLCPYCGTAHWCPAEDVRVHELRQRAAEQTARMRMLWIGVAVFAVMLAGVVMWGILR